MPDSRPHPVQHLPVKRSELGAISATIRHSDGSACATPLPPDRPKTITPPQAENDEQLILLWLHGRSEHTQRAYRADLRRLLRFLEGTPLHRVTLRDLQAFADAVDRLDLKPKSKHRVLSTTKSLFAFAHRLGYLPFDVGKPLRLPTLRDTLSERILDEPQVQRMIALEANPRNHAILLLLYGSGVRVSELCGLRWRDCQPRHDGGQVTVLGKGGKTRSIRLPASVWVWFADVYARRHADAPVFLSRKGGALHAAQVSRIVRRAAQRAGIPQRVSAHWLRHAHASHALDRRAPIHLVQQTLGHASVATTGRYLHARPNESSSNYLPL